MVIKSNIATIVRKYLYFVVKSFFMYMKVSKRAVVILSLDQLNINHYSDAVAMIFVGWFRKGIINQISKPIFLSELIQSSNYIRTFKVIEMHMSRG